MRLTTKDKNGITYGYKLHWLSLHMPSLTERKCLEDLDWMLEGMAEYRLLSKEGMAVYRLLMRHLYKDSKFVISDKLKKNKN